MGRARRLCDVLSSEIYKTQRGPHRSSFWKSERESERFYGGHFVVSEIRVSEKRLPAGTAPFSWTPSIFLLHLLVTHRVSLWVSSCIENDSSKSMSCMLFVRTTRLG